MTGTSTECRKRSFDGDTIGSLLEGVAAGFQPQSLLKENEDQEPRPSHVSCTVFHPITNKRPRKYTKPRPWVESFALLVSYKEEHGHCNTPYYYAPDRYLGDWVAKQRKHKDNPKLLSQEQRDLLDGIGFEWCSTQERIWNEKYARLQNYFRRFGNAVVPSAYHDGHGTDLSNWVAKQRQIHAQDRMSQERFEKLNSVQFVWRIKQFSSGKERDHTREDQKWNEKYERLDTFRKQFGTCAVPFQYELDKSLGRWVNEQRTQNTRGLLREDRKQMLNKLEFLWRINHSTSKPGEPDAKMTKKAFAKKKAVLHELQQKKPNQGPLTTKLGTCPLPPTNNTAESYHTPEIVSDDTDKENSLPISSIIEVVSQQPVNDCFKKESFETMFHRLINFKRENGHVSIPPSYNTLGLGPWIASVKQQAREGLLEEDKAMKLRTAGVIVQGEDQIWVEYFNHLRIYIDEHRHSLVSTLDDPELAVWTASQRFLYHQKKLRPDRKARLDAVQFEFDIVKVSVAAVAHLVPQDEDSDDVDLHDLEGGIFAAASSWNA